MLYHIMSLHESAVAQLSSGPAWEGRSSAPTPRAFVHFLIAYYDLAPHAEYCFRDDAYMGCDIHTHAHAQEVVYNIFLDHMIWVQREVCGTFFGRGMGMNTTARYNVPRQPAVRRASPSPCPPAPASIWPSRSSSARRRLSDNICVNPHYL